MTDEPIDARSLLCIPKIERDRIMEQAAALAAADYKPGGSLDIWVEDVLILLCDYDGFYNRETETGNATELANLIDEAVDILKGRNHVPKIT